MDWLISSANAQAAPAAGAPGGNLSFIIMLVGMFALMYFMVIRPQSKRAKEHRAMVSSLEAGSEIATQGGIVGKVTEVSEQFLTVEIADNVRIKLQRHMVAQVFPKGTLKGA